jgi:hypothetical protein
LYFAFFSGLQATFLKEAIANFSASSVNQEQSSAGQNRKRHAQVQEKIQGLWNTVNLFSKAIDLFEGKMKLVTQQAVYSQLNCVTTCM